MYIENESTEGSNTNPADAATATTTETPKVEGSTEGATTEGQDTGGDKAAATDENKADDGQTKDEAEGAPESYETFNIPEGYTLDGERLEMATGLFKDLNLPQAQAQKLVDAFIKADTENGEARGKLYGEAQAQQIEEWGKQTRDALGEKYDATVADARYAATLVKDPEVVKAFDELGWGNHPAMVKFCAHFGALFKESGMDGVGGGRGEGGEKSFASRMYPNM